MTVWETQTGFDLANRIDYTCKVIEANIVSLRDQLAMQALNGIIASYPNGEAVYEAGVRETMAARAYAMADAMLKAREN